MEYFPTKAPAFCKIWYDLTEIWVSGLGLASRGAYVLREEHVKTCEQCKAAQQSVHTDAGESVVSTILAHASAESTSRKVTKRTQRG